jgi:hypothetical protein
VAYLVHEQLPNSLPRIRAASGKAAEHGIITESLVCFVDERRDHIVASEPLIEGEGLRSHNVSIDAETDAVDARSSFKTSQELARPFPFGVLASQVCPYCYSTGYSSPGTRCSYCAAQKRRRL